MMSSLSMGRIDAGRILSTFNDLVDNNRQVVVSADKSPSDLEGMEERLRSRLGWGLVADIHFTTMSCDWAFYSLKEWYRRCGAR